MAQKIICDICGKEADTSERIIVGTHAERPYPRYNEAIPVDACSTCVGKADKTAFLSDYHKAKAAKAVKALGGRGGGFAGEEG